MKPCFNILIIFFLTLFAKEVVGQVTWAGAASCVSGSSTSWGTTANWCTGAIPTSGQIAQFNCSSSCGTAQATTMSVASSLTHGAIEVTSSRNNALTINASSSTKTFTLDGATVNSVNNVIIRNGSSILLTLMGNANQLNIILGNTTDNIINIDGTGGITISSIISGTNKLTKDGSGSGVLTLSGANTYSGGTTITGGTLTLGAAGVLADAGTVTLNGGTFKTGTTTGFSETVGTLALTANSAITLGTGSHSLTFAASNGVSWTGGAILTINGWAIGTEGKIFVGTDASGLTAGQLAQIQFYDGSTYYPAIILSTGEVVSNSFTSAQNGDWNTGSTWTAGSVPPAGATVTVNHIVSLAASLTNTGSITVSSSGTLQINGGGYVSGTDVVYAATGSTLIMNHNSGLYGISSGQAFWPSTNPPYNVTIQGTGAQLNGDAGAKTVAGTLALSAQFANAASSGITINGTFQLNSGGWISSNAPVYGSSSTLKYNSTGTYGRGIEWSATSGAGYPANVQISNTTTLDLGNGGTATARQMSGNLVIDDGSTFSMNVNQMTASLTVLGNVTVGGGTSGVLTLSGQSGGDLVVKGDFTLGSGATLTANSRRVTFNGTSSQAISGSPTFSYITVDNSSGLTLSSSISVDNELRITTGTLDLNGSNNISLATAATLIESAGNLITNTGSPSAGNGYISITKALNSPASDNVGGLGAIITASSDMGSTTIKRFHKARTETGLGGTQNSVSRYYLIDPTNSGTSATIVFSYDETELNSNAEGASPIKLNLYNSTTEASGYSLQESTSTDATANTVTKSSITYATAATYWTVATNSYATATSNNWSNTATWAAGSVPASGTPVTINHTVTIDMNPTCSSITINSGKILQYQNTTTVRTLTVTGDMTVNGTFKTGPQDADVSHQFVLGGNLIIGNAATFDLRAATSPSTRKTLTTFDGSSDVTISSPGTPSQVDFAEITVNKDAPTNKVTYTISTKDPTVPGTGQTISYPSGIWEQSVGTIAFGTTTQDIPTEGSAGGGMQVTGSGSVSFNASIKIRNNGVFLVNTSGTVTVGDAESEGFLMDGSVNYTVTFQSGTVNIAGRIGNISAAPGNVWIGTLIISGATVNVPTVGLNNSDMCVFCTPIASGTFTMSSGNLNILQANQGSYAGADLDIIDATSTISGGTITIGNDGSSGSVNFDIGSTENLNLLVVNSGTLTVGTLTNLTITNANSPLTITTGNINLKEKTINLNNVNNGVAITVSGANRTVTSGTGTGYINISSDNSGDVKTISYLSSGELTIGSAAVLRIGNCQLNYVTTASCTFASNGTFEILSGGSVTVAAPTYASGSYLKYSTNSSFNRDAEWNTPHHVIVTNTFGATDVHTGNNAPGLSLTMNGNLTIESGSTLNMDSKTASLTIMGNVLNSGGTITMSNAFGGDINLYGNFQNDGNFTCNERSVYFKGTTTQTVSGTNAIVIDYMRIENGVGGSITLSREVAIDNEASFTSGIITSTATLLTFNAGSSIVDLPDDASFVNGPVKKIGNTNFIFPTGKNSNYQPIAISGVAGNLITDAFTAEYFMANPQTAYGTSKDGTIDHLSLCEYWVLNQSVGTPTAIVEAAFDANSCGVTSLPDLILARWDGGESKWKDHTGGCTNCYTGNTTAGTVYSDAVISSFSPFTLASKTAQPNNPLPIDLLNFDAKYNNKKVALTWSTASETNNDYFILEKSSDGVNFESFAKVDGAGNSNVIQNYEYNDQLQTSNFKPQTIYYYRLKQTDFDGKYTYSNIVSVNITDNEAIRDVWFNNENQELNIEFNSISSSDFIFNIYDICGKQLINKSAFIDGKMNYTINLQSLPSGIYTVSISSNTDKFIKKVVTF